MFGSLLGVAAAALLTLLIWSPWSSDEDVWVRQTSHTPEQVQDQYDPQESENPQENITPPQPKQEFEKTKEDEEDEPVMFAEEKATPDQPAETISDVVVNNENATEAGRYSTLTADKEIASQDYKELTEGARMLASDLGIRVVSASIKEFNSTHFDRLAKMLNEPEYQGKELHLVGIAGSVDSRFIAKNRADFAKEILVNKYKIPIAIATYGIDPHSEEPARGQRLEAWVK